MLVKNKNCKENTKDMMWIVQKYLCKQKVDICFLQEAPIGRVGHTEKDDGKLSSEEFGSLKLRLQLESKGYKTLIFIRIPNYTIYAFNFC